MNAAVSSQVQKVLITGANGQVGYNLCRFFLEADVDVLGSARQSPLHSHYSRWKVLDLESPALEQDLFGLPKIDAIVHCAAFTDVNLCEKEKNRAFQINVISTGKLASLARARQIPLLYLSTDFVFEGNTGGYLENSQTYPKGYYSKTKLWGEKEVLNVEKGFVLRFTPLDHPFLLPHHKGGFLRMLQKASDENKSLRLFRDKTLSPVSSREIFETIFKILKADDFPRINHLACKEALSVLELGEIIQERLKLKLIIESSQWPDNDYASIRPRYSHLDSLHCPQKSVHEILTGILDP